MKINFITNQYSQQRQREKPVYIYPVLMAMQAQFYRNLGHDVRWNDPSGEIYDKVVTEPENIDFLSLPYPDRIWTGAFDKRYQIYGNYKYHPATHMQVADGCWHGQCSFCVENGRGYKIREIDHVLAEIDDCRRLGIREIFDDSGTFPTGLWMTEFCCKFITMRTGITLGCNMRIGANVDWEFMKEAGFRMVLFGVESFNQKTLDKINKGVQSADIIPTIKAASQAGLEPHVAVMFGYPWSSAEEEYQTLEGVHYLLRKGYAKTAQASYFDVPSNPVINNGMATSIYGVAKYPEFWFNQLKNIRSLDDFKYLLKGIRKGIVRD